MASQMRNAYYRVYRKWVGKPCSRKQEESAFYGMVRNMKTMDLPSPDRYVELVMKSRNPNRGIPVPHELGGVAGLQYARLMQTKEREYAAKIDDEFNDDVKCTTVAEELYGDGPYPLEWAVREWLEWEAHRKMWLQRDREERIRLLPTIYTHPTEYQGAAVWVICLSLYVLGAHRASALHFREAERDLERFELKGGVVDHIGHSWDVLVDNHNKYAEELKNLLPTKLPDGR